MNRTPTLIGGYCQFLLLVCAIAAMTACDLFTGDSPRAGWERAMKAYGERDYGGLWDSLSDVSKQDTIRVLIHVQRDAKYRETMRVKFHIPPAVLANIPPREFFIALMTGVDRTAPQMIALRAAAARSAEFSRQEIMGDRAVVFWRSERGGPEKMAFVFEADRWKPIIQR